MVQVKSGAATPTTLRIVGTATMPAIGGGFPQHLEMGVGALLSFQLIPPAARNVFADPITGPNVILVRVRAGANRQAVLHSLQQIANPLSNSANFGVTVVAVLRPAEIVNYRTVGTTPALLGLALAAGAVSALALTLLASVRRRRRDLALLKTLGFTRLQLAAAVAWQSTVAATIGVLVGVPLGIALGRELWTLFARNIHIVPKPSVPAFSIVVAAVGGLVLANIVAALPGRIAARTPAALVLRAE
jgi:ABC-type antimicrobial peptide transport system permease subunit